MDVFSVTSTSQANLQAKSHAATTKNTVFANATLYTMHGCECAENWHHDGLVLHGCVFSDFDQPDTENKHPNNELPWCFVKDPDACERGYHKDKLLDYQETSLSTITSGVCANLTSCEDTHFERTGKWDFCSLKDHVDHHLPHRSCHCMPTWEHKRKL